MLTYNISGKSYMGFLVYCMYVLCALIRLANFNVMEEERQEMESGRGSYYLRLLATASALLLPAFYMIGNRIQYGSRGLL